MFISILKNFVFEKMTKKSRNDVSRVVWMAIGDVAMFFCLWKIYRFVALEKLYRTSKARKNVHFNFEEIFFRKDVKKPRNDISRVVWMAVVEVAKLFCLCEIYSFVGLEKLYRTSKARKIFIATLEAKISFKMKVY